MYTPLPTSRSIRLLELLPGSAPDIIQTRIHVVDLGHSPTYLALSYVWGQMEPAVHIMCDGESIPITPNLASALQHFRRPEPAPCPFWIDAICINQKDDDEKSQQVSFMKDIYSCSRNILVWLGEDDGGQGAKAVSMIERIYPHVKKELESRKFHGHGPFIDEERDSERKNHRDLPLPGHEEWKSVFWLFNREWFTRVWVIQEISQHQKTAFMIVGNCMVPWAYVGIAAHWIEYKNYHFICDGRGLIDRCNALLPAKNLYNCGAKGLGRIPFPILKLLGDFALAKATDPRDKLFAFIGLSREYQGSQSADRASLIRPQYRKRIPEVFADLVRYLVSAPIEPAGLNGLDVLGCRVFSRVIEHRKTLLGIATDPSLLGSPGSTIVFPHSLGSVLWDQGRLGKQVATLLSRSGNLCHLIVSYSKA